MIDREQLILVVSAVVVVIAVSGLVGMAAYLTLSAERVRRETAQAIAFMENYIARLEVLLNASNERRADSRLR